jgi:hypothetical protein
MRAGDVSIHIGDVSRHSGDVSRHSVDVSRHRGDVSRHSGDVSRQWRCVKTLENSTNIRDCINYAHGASQSSHTICKHEGPLSFIQ